MRVAALFRRRRQGEFHVQRKINDLGPSGSAAARVAASSAAILLVSASAGFGCVYAYAQGAHHGAALAVLAVCMALGLELSKPYAVEAVFSSLRNLAIGRALAMLTLAVVAIGYSLTAELSLMAMTRGDAAAGRAKAADTAKDDRGELERIVAERSAMTFTPASEESVAAAREAVTAAERTRKAECSQRGKSCRLRESEESMARQRLADVAAAKVATDRAKALDDRADAIRTRLEGAPATSAADPGAAALAAYLQLLGVTIPAPLLSHWLVLVGVLALEVGSALAVVLVRAAGPREGRRVPVHEFQGKMPPQPAEPPAGPQRVSKKSRRGRPAKERLEAQAKVIDLLKANRGRLPKNSTTRKLGKMAGARKSTMHLALAALIAAGAVARTASGGLVLTS
jgi:hypothetical protein